MGSISMKKKMRNILLQCYTENGYLQTMNLIDNKINESIKNGSNPEAINNICGEMAEIICEILLIEFCKKYPNQCFFSKGLCLADKLREGYTTELDLTLFTPSKIILVESKFRRGSVQITDACNIVTGYGNYDVHGQNKHHLKILGQYTEPYKLRSDTKPYSLALFLESKNDVSDMRNPEWKERMPYLNRKNFVSQLHKLAFSTVSWDVKKMHQVMQYLDAESDKNFEKHLKRLKGANHDQRN